MSEEIARVNVYKGGTVPSPLLPLSCAALGLLSLTCSSRECSQNLSLIFFAEFLFGAAARSTSTKASFSPAAAQAAGVAPFALIQANRIHQNHIESFLTLTPIALACAAAGVDTPYVVAAMLTWILARILYRIGYCNDNPCWRLCGTAACGIQFIMCVGLFIRQKLK